MKKFFGAAVLLLAAVGAYATAKNTALDLVYIQISAGECRLVEAQKCDNLGTGCIEEAFTVGTSTSLGFHQLYQDPPSVGTTCVNAFQP